MAQGRLSLSLSLGLSLKLGRDSLAQKKTPDINTSGATGIGCLKLNEKAEINLVFGR